jgi:hypothetical protein
MVDDAWAERSGGNIGVRIQTGGAFVSNGRLHEFAELKLAGRGRWIGGKIVSCSQNPVRNAS